MFLEFIQEVQGVYLKRRWLVADNTNKGGELF